MIWNSCYATRTGLNLLLLGILLGAFHIISPVADMVLGISYALHGAMLVAILIYLLVGPGLEKQQYASSYGRMFQFAMQALALAVLGHMLAHPSSVAPDLRYLLTLGIGLGIYYRVPLKSFESALSALIWFFFSYFLYSIFVHFLLLTGFVELEEWAVAKLKWLTPNNPMTTMAEDGTQSYLVFYSMGIARLDDLASIGPFSFVRWTGFFVEPSDGAFILGPLFLLTLHRLRSQVAIWLLPLLAISAMLLWGFATSGFMAIALVLVLRCILAPTGNRTFFIFVKLAAVIVFGALVAALSISPEALLDLLGGNKLAQFEYFKEEFLLGLDTYFSPSIFGFGVGADLGHRPYGILSVLAQHGWFPFVGIVLVVGMLLAPAVILLGTDSWLIGGAGVVTLTLFLKYPDVVNLYSLFVGIYVLKAWQFLTQQDVP